MGIVRAEVKQRMLSAVKAGVSANRFIQDMRAKGLSYRRTTMLGDYREVSGGEKKKGLLRYVRKDRYPATTDMAALSVEASAEYLYKLRYSEVLKPVKKEDWKFVNLMSDVPLTPSEIMEQTEQQWGEWEKYRPEAVLGLQVWTAYQRESE